MCIIDTDVAAGRTFITAGQDCRYFFGRNTDTIIGYDKDKCIAFKPAGDDDISFFGFLFKYAVLD